MSEQYENVAADEALESSEATDEADSDLGDGSKGSSVVGGPPA
jgi:hypothetical protein